MLQALADVLALIVQPCYDLTSNWWIAIFLFTLITKAILMPMALWCQKNAIIMVQLMPDLNRLKVKYFGDRETIGEKQNEQYKEKHYHPLLSLVPLAVQVSWHDSYFRWWTKLDNASARGFIRGPYGLCTKPNQSTAARTITSRKKHDQRIVHRPIVHIGRICSWGHGLLLDCLESVFYRCTSTLQRHHATAQIY